jgi:hypothetical protein
LHSQILRHGSQKGIILRMCCINLMLVEYCLKICIPQLMTRLTLHGNSSTHE